MASDYDCGEMWTWRDGAGLLGDGKAAYVAQSVVSNLARPAAVDDYVVARQVAVVLDQ